jgi:hypothetical protein
MSKSLKRKEILTTLVVYAAVASAMAQVTARQTPRLVVGIAIDQLRTDYLEAFAPLYGDAGFKRLLTMGQVYSNVQYPSKGIDRASALATIVTGSAPYNHGIIGLDWMDRSSLQPRHCVDDREYKGVNTTEGSSPRNLLVSTIGDELKVATEGKAIVFSVAPNREEAVLAAGHAADWAMWIDTETGHWAGTTYYGSQPSWFRHMDGVSNLAGRIRDMEWKPTNDYIGTYNYYLATNQKSFTHKFEGQRAIRQLKQSALINEEITRAASYCLSSGLGGLDNVTDFVSLCYYAGNWQGKSTTETTTELQDTYKRLDSEIEKLLSTIDKLVGLDKTLIYLTSTGYESQPESQALVKYRIPTGNFSINRCAALLNMYLVAMYGPGQYVEAYYGNQIYLNHKFLEQKQLKLSEVLAHSEDFLFQFSGVRDVYTSTRMTQGAWTPGMSSMLGGYNPKCSGDITLQIVPGWNLVNEDRGSSRMQRDSFFEFPIIFFGYKLEPLKVATPVTVDCIAPTVAHHIRIRAPNGCSTPPLF